MFGMFFAASSFNGDLSKWDVSRVYNMYVMFASASSFNGDLSKWDVSRVTNMKGMFSYASSFNSDISKWDVRMVSNMEEIFLGALSFNHTLCSGFWATSHLAMFEGQDNMFQGCPSVTTSTSSPPRTSTPTPATNMISSPDPNKCLHLTNSESAPNCGPPKS